MTTDEYYKRTWKDCIKYPPKKDGIYIIRRKDDHKRVWTELWSFSFILNHGWENLDVDGKCEWAEIPE